MMKLTAAVAVVVILAFGLISMAQEKPAKPASASAPQLKPEVALELSRSQNDLYRQALQLKQLQEQLKTAGDAFQAAQTKYQGLVAGALKLSGVDDKKYQLNPESLEVTEKVATPEPAKP